MLSLDGSVLVLFISKYCATIQSLFILTVTVVKNSLVDLYKTLSSACIKALALSLLLQSYIAMVVFGSILLTEGLCHICIVFLHVLHMNLACSV